MSKEKFLRNKVDCCEICFMIILVRFIILKSVNIWIHYFNSTFLTRKANRKTGKGCERDFGMIYFNTSFEYFSESRHNHNELHGKGKNCVWYGERLH